MVKFETAQTENERLRADLEEARKDVVKTLDETRPLIDDATRYRFLRGEHHDIAPLCQVVWKQSGKRESSEWVNVVDADDLDTLIDGAIAARAKMPT
jgi:hypothetical protein